jgi:transcriptional regulator with XRE-family HTH domain
VAQSRLLPDNGGVTQATYEGFRKGVGAAIRTRREAAKLTLEELAHQAGLTVGHLFVVESGRTNPTLQTLFRVASALGVKVGALMDEAERPRSARKS